MKSKYIIYFILFLVIILAILYCRFPWVWGDKDLGNKYILWKDGNNTSIVYCESVPFNGTGLNVIPSKVISFDFDKVYIVAINWNSEKKVKNYWLINKRISINLNDCNDQKSCDSLLRSNVKGPMDSITYYSLKNRLKIALELSEK